MMIDTNPTSVETLKVPGASLYYEVRGSGPALLMIPGGPADAGVFAQIAPLLADRYTVVTYDPRGNSRSRVEGAPEDWRADVHADDASRLLSAVAKGPAYVFGNSGGAQVGLALAARHPEQVRTLVAHEPPAVELLPDRERQRANMQEVYDLYRRDGVGAAMAKFMAGAGLKPPPPREGAPTPEMAEVMARMGRNVDLFLAHGLRTIGGCVPDVAALRRGSTRVVVAGGEASRGLLAYQTSEALAQQLGTTVVEVPGDHGGFGSQPAAFCRGAAQDPARGVIGPGPATARGSIAALVALPFQRWRRVSRPEGELPRSTGAAARGIGQTVESIEATRPGERVERLGHAARVQGTFHEKRVARVRPITPWCSSSRLV